MQQRPNSEQVSQGLTRLSRAGIGATWVLLKIENPQDPHVIRLCEMGLVQGARLEVLRMGTSGAPFLIRANDIDLCVEEELTDHFLLTKYNPATPGEES